MEVGKGERRREGGEGGEREEGRGGEKERGRREGGGERNEMGGGRGGGEGGGGEGEGRGEREVLAVLNLQQRFNGRYEMAIHVVLGHQGLPTRLQCERKHGRRVVLR